MSSVDDAKKLFSHISNAKVCEGNIDTGLPKLTTKEKENMNINESKTSTRLETPELKQFNKVRATIRNQNCTLLTDNEKRPSKDGKATIHRSQGKEPHVSMTKAELAGKLTSVTKENKELKC